MHLSKLIIIWMVFRLSESSHFEEEYVRKILWAYLLLKQNFYPEIQLLGKVWSRGNCFGLDVRKPRSGLVGWIPRICAALESLVLPERLSQVHSHADIAWPDVSLPSKGKGSQLSATVDSYFLSLSADEFWNKNRWYNLNIWKSFNNFIIIPVEGHCINLFSIISFNSVPFHNKQMRVMIFYRWGNQILKRLSNILQVTLPVPVGSGFIPSLTWNSLHHFVSLGLYSWGWHVLFSCHLFVLQIFSHTKI